jgi:hypothetical protein
MLGEARHGIVDPRLGAALAEGYTLPAAWYTEPAWFAREQEQIFRRTWQYVGWPSRLPSPEISSPPRSARCRSS